MRHDSSQQGKGTNYNLHCRRAAVRDCAVIRRLQVSPLYLIRRMVVATCDSILLFVCVLLCVCCHGIKAMLAIELLLLVVLLLLLLVL